MTPIIRLGKSIRANRRKVFNAFSKVSSLRAWYDPRCRLDRFRIGGRLVGDNYPSAEIVAILPQQMIVNKFTDIVTGLGVWSFADTAGGRTTSLVFHHIDASSDREERASQTYYWKGLIQNLAAFCEGRALPFDHDSGEYKLKRDRPKRGG